MASFKNWIGKQQVHEGMIDHHHASLLAATLDLPVPKNGSELPQCWHWAWFNEARPPSELGRDGHPAKGGFIPALPSPRRMWAGGNLTFHKPVLVGRHHRKISSIEQIEQKDGASGALFIVTIRHRLFDEDDDLCVDEVQNLVYRDDPDPNAPPQQFPLAPGNAETTREFKPDSTLLFRYSALTFNGHRIHYDLDYARKVEGYSNLVLHAPLSATLLCQLGNEQLSDVPLRSFHYRATAPVFCGETVRLCARGNGNRVQLWIEKTGGIQAMISTAEG